MYFDSSTYLAPSAPHLPRLELSIRMMLFLLFLIFSVLVASTKKTTLRGGQSRSWSAEQGKKEKEKESGNVPSPLPPHAARSEKTK